MNKAKKLLGLFEGTVNSVFYDENKKQIVDLFDSMDSLLKTVKIYKSDSEKGYKTLSTTEFEDDSYRKIYKQLEDSFLKNVAEPMVSLQLKIKRMRTKFESVQDQKFIDFRNSMKNKVDPNVYNLFYMNFLGVKTYKDAFELYKDVMNTVVQKDNFKVSNNNHNSYIDGLIEAIGVLKTHFTELFGMNIDTSTLKQDDWN